MVGHLFTILLFGSCSYACIAGGKEGRWTACVIILAALLSIPASYLDYAWSRTHWPVLVVDLMLLVALTVLAVRSRRFYPVWMAGFHFASIATHVATMAEPRLKPLLYFALQSFWSLPVLLAMVLGIMLDRRAGLSHAYDQPSRAGRAPPA